MNYQRTGKGKPLLLIHGLGGSRRSWDTILPALVTERDVIAIDLPGFGDTPPVAGHVTIAKLADAITEFLREHDLLGIDAVGSSMGGRLVLELARRGGVVGAVVSLDPGGFWQGWERHALFASMTLSISLLRALEHKIPQLTRSVLGRRILFAQFAEHPERIPPDVALNEMQSYVSSPSFDGMLYDLVYGAEQQGSPKGTITKPLVIGWGLSDHVCFPGQAQRAMDLFEDARLYWFKDCGHFPQWDSPAETVRLILKVVA
jgi:pimeloyl-ACP methyl ester carboxylesterase